MPETETFDSLPEIDRELVLALVDLELAVERHDYLVAHPDRQLPAAAGNE